MTPEWKGQFNRVLEELMWKMGGPRYSTEFVVIRIDDHRENMIKLHSGDYTRSFC